MLLKRDNIILFAVYLVFSVKTQKELVTSFKEAP